MNVLLKEEKIDPLVCVFLFLCACYVNKLCFQNSMELGKTLQQNRNLYKCYLSHKKALFFTATPQSVLVQ